jgi:hypothetical protein
VIDEIMSGAIDMHVHFGPDSLLKRRQDALRVAQTAREIGLRAIVLKSREYNTVPVALLVTELVPEVLTFGSLTLDNEVGGLNVAAVIAAVRMGAKVVWMPTITAANSKDKTEAAVGIKLAGTGQSLLDDAGNLRSEVKEIVRIVKEGDVVLGTGHVSPPEIIALAREAKEANFSKLMITHAIQTQLLHDALTNEEIKSLARGGAIIEYSFWSWMPCTFRADPAQIVESIKDIGAEHCVMSSDFGQDYNPPAPEGLRIFVATMLHSGLTEKQIELMIKTNPAKLLNLS